MHRLEMETASNTYTRTAIGLHWAIALLIFAAFPLGLYMHDLPLSPDKLRLYSYHKWIGIAVFGLALVRVTWRAVHPLPALPHTMLPWERFVALVVHGLLYVLIFAAPVSGWLTSSAEGFQTVWFGVIPLPDLIGRDKELARSLGDLHANLNFLMLAIVGAHALAALKHHFVERDDVFTRMVPVLARSPKMSIKR